MAEEKAGARWILPGTLLLALVVRAVNIGPVLLQDSPRLIGPDPYYHIRRILLAIRHFPHLPGFDAYLGFPDGAYVPYEPGFDSILAGWVKAASLGGTPNEETTMALCAAIMPLLGLLVFPVFLNLARRFGGRRVSGPVAFLLAILPGVVFSSQLGQVDHHVLEPVLIGLVLVTVMDVMGQPSRWQPMVFAGLVLGGGLYFWRGMILPAGVVAAGLGLRTWWANGLGKIDFLSRWGGGVIMGTAAGLGFLISAFYGGPEPLSYFTLSFLQPLVFASCGVGLCLIGQLPTVRSILGPSPGLSALSAMGRLVAMLVVGLLPFLVTALVLGEFLPNLLNGFGFLARDGAFVQAVGEQRPLFQDDDGGFSLLYLVYFYGSFSFLLPLFLWGACRCRAQQRRGESSRCDGESFGGSSAGERGRRPDYQWWLFCLWSAVALIMGVTQRRYANLLAPTYCVWLGMGLVVCWDWLLGRSRAAWGMVAAGGTVLLLPGMAMIGMQAFVPVQKEPLLKAMAWLRAQTPETAGYDAWNTGGTGARPEYGVVAWWDEGHHLVTLAHRPNIANPFGIEWFGPGLERAAQVWLATESELAETLDTTGARYMLLSFRMGLLRSAATFIGHPERQDDIAVRSGDGWVPGPAWANFASVRLFLEDGVGAGDRPATPGVRLVWEGGTVGAHGPAARWAGPNAPMYKVIERIPCARVKGNAPRAAGSLLSCPSRPTLVGPLTGARALKPTLRVLFNWPHVMRMLACRRLGLELLAPCVFGSLGGRRKYRSTIGTCGMGPF